MQVLTVLQLFLLGDQEKAGQCLYGGIILHTAGGNLHPKENENKTDGSFRVSL